jgi:ribosomal protein S18 acetylase RimI-like enzyme
MVIDALTADGLDELEPLWNALREHHAEVVVEWLPEVRPRAEAWSLRRAQYEGWLAAGDGFGLIAREGEGEGGGALGYAFVVMGEGSATWPLGKRNGEVETLALLPAARGDGIGAALLDAARDEAARRGAEGIALLVAEGNEGAMRFYEREGFRPFARLVYAPLDPPD